MKTIRLLPLFASLILVCAFAPAAHAGVTVTKVSYAGWHGALRISNGVVSAVVVPQIGRIMAFQMVNRPETDAIFVNKDWVGKLVAGVPVDTWANFGGDKLWPSEEASWQKHAPRSWPPDQAFDGDPETATILKNGVMLATPMSASFAARDTRTITMRVGEPCLYIHQVLYKDPKAAGSKNAFPIGIWSITQTRGDGTIFLPATHMGQRRMDLYVSDTDWTPYPKGPAGVATYWKPVDGVAVGRRDPVNSRKVGSKTGAGWIASLYDGNVLFSEHYAYQKGKPYADGGLPAECYTNGGTTAYIEMEVLGPISPLKAGNSMTYDVTWQLGHLSRTPLNDDDACALVKLSE